MCYLCLQPLDVALPASWVLVEAVAAAALPADVVAVDGASAGLFVHKYHTKEYYDLPKMIYLLDWPYRLHEQLVNN